MTLAPREQANEVLEPIRSYRRRAPELFGSMPFPMLNGMFDALYPPVCSGTGKPISSRN